MSIWEGERFDGVSGQHWVIGMEVVEKRKGDEPGEGRGNLDS
jgi:hypothetical protein